MYKYKEVTSDNIRDDLKTFTACNDLSEQLICEDQKNELKQPN